LANIENDPDAQRVYLEKARKNEKCNILWFLVIIVAFGITIFRSFDEF